MNFLWYNMFKKNRTPKKFQKNSRKISIWYFFEENFQKTQRRFSNLGPKMQNKIACGALHFTGASFLCVTMLLFGSPSFYRNIILLEQLCLPNLSPSFYDSTFKKFSQCPSLIFTGSLLLH